MYELPKNKEEKEKEKTKEMKKGTGGSKWRDGYKGQLARTESDL